MNIISNKAVKKILTSRGFFHDCNQVAKILEPLRNTVLFLEERNINLADCFVMLIQLAVKINKIPNESGVINFKYHCIDVMNSRWDSFDLDPYLLAFWLHPKYRGNVFIVL